MDMAMLSPEQRDELFRLEADRRGLENNLLRSQINKQVSSLHSPAVIALRALCLERVGAFRAEPGERITNVDIVAFENFLAATDAKSGRQEGGMAAKKKVRRPGIGRLYTRARNDPGAVWWRVGPRQNPRCGRIELYEFFDSKDYPTDSKFCAAVRRGSLVPVKTDRKGKVR